MKNTLKSTLALSSILASVSGFAASFQLSGDYRFGSNMIVNGDLFSSERAGAGNTTSFLEQRLLLRPDVLIDDRFTLKTEWSLLQATGPNTLPSQFGTPLDGSLSQAAGNQLLQVNYAYLNWASDWGLFRFGRMPKSWGLGVLHDSGTGALDDFKTIADRAEFQALLGNIGLRVAFEKERERRLATDGDDHEAYELGLDFTNSGTGLNVGILYARNVRSGGDGLSSHDLSIFGKKQFGLFQAAGEFVSISNDDGSRNGILAQVDYFKGPIAVGYDFAFASYGDAGAFQFNPNYRPFMLLFRHSLGRNITAQTVRNAAGVGSDVTKDGGGGALVNKVHATYDFGDQSYVLGADLGMANLQQSGFSGETNLGIETDLHLSQKWYDNFKMQYSLGFLFPGAAFGPDQQVGWGLEIKGVLNF